MISVVTIENAHIYGDVLPSLHRLRYQGFKERQNYNVPSYKGMEFDAYDTPATTHFVWRDECGVVRGCARTLPTTMPYMIEDLWPNSVSYVTLPKCDNVWEASRMCIDKTLPVPLRKQIHGEIVCALQEFGIANNIEWMIGVMTWPIWRSVFLRVGWPIEFLGPEYKLSPKESIYTGKMLISASVLKEVRGYFNITSSVISRIEEQSFEEQKRKRA